MKNKKAKAISATFGAAMSTMWLAPALEADLVGLTGNLPGTLSSIRQNVDFIGGTSADWLQWNDTLGKTVTAAGYLAGIRQTAVSNVLSAGATFANLIYFGTNLSGTYTFGFLTTGGNVGWLRILYAPGTNSPVQYLAAAYEDAGNPILVGGAVPEPSAFGLVGLAGLAAGAAGRRKKKK